MPGEFDDILSTLDTMEAKQKSLGSVQPLNITSGNDDFSDILSVIDTQGGVTKPPAIVKKESFVDRVKRNPKELLDIIEGGFFPDREPYDPSKSDLENVPAHLRNLAKGAVNFPFVLPEMATGIARRVIGEPLERYIAGDESATKAVGIAGKAVVEEAKGFLNVMKMAVPYVNRNQWQEIFTHPEMVLFGAKTIEHLGTSAIKLTKGNTLRRGLAEDALKSGNLEEAAKQVTEITKTQPESVEEVSKILAEKMKKHAEAKGRQDVINKEMPNALEDTLARRAQGRQAEIDKLMPTEPVRASANIEAIKPVEDSMQRLDSMVEEIKAVGKEEGYISPKGTFIPITDEMRAIKADKLQVAGETKPTDTTILENEKHIQNVLSEIEKLRKLQDVAEQATGMNLRSIYDKTIKDVVNQLPGEIKLEIKSAIEGRKESPPSKLPVVTVDKVTGKPKSTVPPIPSPLTARKSSNAELRKKVDELKSQKEFENLPREELVRLASSDSLTGLPNKLAFKLSMSDEVSKVDKPTIGFLDLRGLKGINSKYGYDAGDAAIKSVADVLEKNGLEVFKGEASDEFQIRFKESPEDAQKILDKVNAELMSTEVDIGNGKKITGVQFTHGTAPIGESGKWTKPAEIKYEENKRALKESGKLVERGETDVKLVGEGETSQVDKDKLIYALKKFKDNKGTADDLEVIKSMRDNYTGKDRELIDKLIIDNTPKGELVSDAAARMDELSKMGPEEIGKLGLSLGLDKTVVAKTLIDRPFVERKIIEAESNPPKPATEIKTGKVKPKETKSSDLMTDKEIIDRIETSTDLRSQFKEVMSKDTLSKEDTKWLAENKDALNLTPDELVDVKSKMALGIAKKFQIVSEDRHTENLKVIKDFFNDRSKLRSGIDIDPKVIKALGENAIYHIERGVKDFYQWSKKVVDEFGERIRPYLHDAWLGAQDRVAKGVKGVKEGIPGFYSKSVEFIKSNFPGARALTKDEANQLIGKWKKSGSVNVSEIPGIEEFINSKDKISKSELLEFVDKNKVGFEVEEYAPGKRFDGGTSPKYDRPELRLPGKEPGTYRERVFGTDTGEYDKVSKVQNELALTPEEFKIRDTTQFDFHFPDVPNAIGWERVDERTIHEKFESGWENKKIKFIDELQESSWVKDARYDENLKKAENTQKEKRTPEQEKIIRQAVIDGFESGKTPEHPLLKQAKEVMLKDSIRDAVENGMEGLGWNTGENVGKRYSLGTYIDELTYTRNNDGTYDIELIKKDRKLSGFAQVSEPDLDRLVGKDEASKLRRNEGEKDGRFRVIKYNEDVFIGNTWAFKLYDQLIPNIIKDLSNKNNWGLEIKDVKDSAGNTIHYVEFTPKLKNDITLKGQPIMGSAIEPKQFISEESYNKALGNIKAHFKGEKPYGEKLFVGGIDPEMVRDAAKVMAYHIEKGAKSFYQASEAMVKQFGEDIRPFLHDAWKVIQEYKDISSGTVEAPKSNTAKIAKRLKMETENPDMEQIGDTFSKPIDKTHTVGKFVDYAVGVMSTRLKNIHPEIMNRTRKWAMDLGSNTAADMNSIAPIIKEINKLSNRDQLTLNYFLANGDYDSALRGSGLTEEAFGKALAAKDALWERYKKIGGKEARDIKDHWPRLIRDYEGLMNYIGKKEVSQIDQAIKNIEMETKETLTSAEKGAVVDKLLRGFAQGRITLGDPRFAKARTIKTYSPGMVKFLASPQEALVHYIHTMNNIVEARKFFGKESTTDTIANRALKKMGIDMDSMLFTEGDLNASIGDIVNKLKEEGLIKNEGDIYKLKSILHSIFKPGKVSNWVSAAENLTYGTTLTNFGSVFTQIADMAMSAQSADVFRSAKHGVKSFVGKSDVRLEDLGFNDIHKELSMDGPLAFAVSNVLKVLGFSKVERTTSEAAINGAYDKYRKMSIKEPIKLLYELKHEYGFNDKDAKQVMEELNTYIYKDGIASVPTGTKMSDGVRLLLFSVINDIKPMSILEMPQGHADAKGSHSTFRLMYTLKRYQIKLFDVYRRRIFQEIKTGDRVEGIKRLVRLAVMLGVLHVGINALKDWWYGREFDLEENIVNTFWNLIGLTRYTPTQISREGIAGAAAKVMMPAAVSVASGMAMDIGTLYGDTFGESGEKGYELPRYMGELGKQYYYRIGEGRRKEEARQARE